MNAWSRWRDRLHRARGWDAPSPADLEIRRLKMLFEAAPESDPEADERLWRRLRPMLHRIERSAAAVPSFGAALTAVGPRFATAALAGLALAFGLYLYQPGTSQPSEQAIASVMASLERPTAPFAEALEARRPDDLLRYIAYSGTRR